MRRAPGWRASTFGRASATHPYAVALTAIALWPVPVDSGVRGILEVISAAIPWLGYDVIEFSANVLLFVPLGILLAIVMPKRRWLVIAIALAVSALIEWLQALFLHERTSSTRDVVANVAGAVLGLAVVLVMEKTPREGSSLSRPNSRQPLTSDPFPHRYSVQTNLGQFANTQWIAWRVTVRAW